MSLKSKQQKHDDHKYILKSLIVTFFSNTELTIGCMENVMLGLTVILLLLLPVK